MWPTLPTSGTSSVPESCLSQTTDASRCQFAFSSPPPILSQPQSCRRLPPSLPPKSSRLTRAFNSALFSTMYSVRSGDTSLIGASPSQCNKILRSARAGGAREASAPRARTHSRGEEEKLPWAPVTITSLAPLGVRDLTLESLNRGLKLTAIPLPVVPETLGLTDATVRDSTSSHSMRHVCDAGNRHREVCPEPCRITLKAFARRCWRSASGGVQDHIWSNGKGVVLFLIRLVISVRRVAVPTCVAAAAKATALMRACGRTYTHAACPGLKSPPKASFRDTFFSAAISTRQYSNQSAEMIMQVRMICLHVPGLQEPGPGLLARAPASIC